VRAPDAGRDPGWSTRRKAGAESDHGRGKVRMYERRRVVPPFKTVAGWVFGF